MKITLAVLFLAGLTIYCKCTAVLSLPPSLIQHAASLERIQTAKSLPPDNEKNTKEIGSVADNAEELDNGFVVNNNNDDDDEDDDDDGVGGALDSSVLYKKFKNLWQKNFILKKREHNSLEDDIAAALAAAVAAESKAQGQQQHQSIEVNKNNKSALKVPPSQQQQQQQKQLQHQQEPQGVFMHKNFLDSLDTSASNLLPIAQHHRNYHLSAMSEDASGPQMLDDDIIVSPSSGSTSTDDNSYEFGAQSDDINSLYDSIHDTENYDESAPNTALDEASLVWSRFLRPLNNWSRLCQDKNIFNCPPEYYSALIADRNNALARHLQRDDTMDFVDDSTGAPSASSVNNINNDEIILLLTAEQKIIRFLSWALAELYPYGKFTNISEHSADAYDPGMYLWKTLNLSGQKEPPLFVEEPRYIIVRREYDPDEEAKRGGRRYHDDPFIPPRGRKHNLPDLDALLQRYETFVPNRGRRDKIKDIFKYDDLFYPNRGKRQMTHATTDKRNDDHAAAKVDIDGNINLKENQQLPQLVTKGENNAAVSLWQQQLQQHPLSKTLEQLNNVMAKMNRKLHQIQVEREQKQKNHVKTFDEMLSKPTKRMSSNGKQLQKRFVSMANILQQQRRPYLPSNNNNNNNYRNNNINSRRQWGKRYSKMADNDRPEIAAVTAPTFIRSRTMASNRLHALRSMSTQTKQQQPHEQLQPLQLLKAASLLTQPPKQQQQTTPEYISPSRLYQTSRFM